MHERRNSRRTPLAIATVCIALAISGAARAVETEPPDVAVNPVTGLVETVDVWIRDGEDTEVRHTVHLNERKQINALISTASADDLGPRIAIDVAGDTMVVWWRAGMAGNPSQVFVRTLDLDPFDPSGSQWSDEALVSGSRDNAFGPELTYFKGEMWTSYETTVPGLTGIVVGRITFDRAPFGMKQLGSSTLLGGSADALIESDTTDNLWVSWIEDDQYVGWREYDPTYACWTAPQSIDYSVIGVAGAREAIADIVAGSTPTCP